VGGHRVGEGAGVLKAWTPLSLLLQTKSDGRPAAGAVVAKWTRPR
jgi:hypothetical protein